MGGHQYSPTRQRYHNSIYVAVRTKHDRKRELGELHVQVERVTREFCLQRALLRLRFLEK